MLAAASADQPALAMISTAHVGLRRKRAAGSLESPMASRTGCTGRNECSKMRAKYTSALMRPQ
jgi:hypothetical protein